MDREKRISEKEELGHEVQVRYLQNITKIRLII